MTDTAKRVQAHYGRGGTLERLLAAVGNAERFKASDLWRYDQLHGRSVQGTREHAERAAIAKGMHVLDLGCGVGGSARFLAETYGCRVTGVDITAEYIEAARELTRRCGLSGLVDYRQADAVAMPFPDGTFDRVYCHYVTMNIPDKRGLAREVARVLRKGGRFTCSEVAQGEGGELVYPLPWADTAADSFVVTPAAMRAALEEGGLRVVEELDLSEAAIAGYREGKARAERGEPPVQINQLAMGDDFPVRARNAAKCAFEHRMVERLFVSEKP